MARVAPMTKCSSRLLCILVWLNLSQCLAGPFRVLLLKSIRLIRTRWASVRWAKWARVVRVPVAFNLISKRKVRTSSPSTRLRTRRQWPCRPTSKHNRSLDSHQKDKQPVLAPGIRRQDLLSHMTSWRATIRQSQSPRSRAVILLIKLVSRHYVPSRLPSAAANQSGKALKSKKSKKIRVSLKLKIK